MTSATEVRSFCGFCESLFKKKRNRNLEKSGNAKGIFFFTLSHNTIWMLYGIVLLDL